MSWIPPGLIVVVFLVLIVSQLVYALLPQQPRRYRSVLALTGAGWLLGQAWLWAGLPAWRLGQADLLPALLFALALQPLAPHLRWPTLNLRGGLPGSDDAGGFGRRP